MVNSDRIAGLEVPPVDRQKGEPAAVGRAVYVVAVTVLLLAAVAYLVRNLDTNPLTMAQNKRVMFTGPRIANDPVFASLPANDPKRLSILFIGNSQSYAIMDYRPGDQCMITFLSDKLNGGSESDTSQFPVRYGSLPNLRVSEVLIKSVSGLLDTEHHPDIILVGVVLDGLRVLEARTDIAETGATLQVSRELTELANDSPELPLALPAVKAMAIAPQKQDNSGRSERGPKTTTLAVSRLEEEVQAKMEQTVPLFRKRQDMYAYFVREFEAQRNNLLRVTTATRRPIPLATYRANLQLLEMAVKYLQQHGIHPVLYFAPIRPIEPNPYDPADVIRFRQDFTDLCARQKAVCFDYSNLVPEDLWTVYNDNDFGGKSGQLDFAHFTGRAHRTVADQLTVDLLPHLRQWLSEKQSQR